MCYIRNVDNCAAICAAVDGCAYFSISAPQPCYACFIYKSCESGGDYSNLDYHVYRLYRSPLPPPQCPMTGYVQMSFDSALWIN